MEGTPSAAFRGADERPPQRFAERRGGRSLQDILPESRNAMAKILGIVGSPRKSGNTHVLASTILEGAEAQGASVELLLLGDLTIGECDGCQTCWQGRPCSKQDDMNGVYPKIAESDAVVFGTPVYWYGPTALMKAFIDRFVYFNCPGNRAQVKGKKAAVAVPFEEESADAAELVTAFFERCCAYLEMELAGTVLAPGVTRRGEVRKKAGTLAEAYELGRRLSGAE
jgi:multimeric flavodoxin WrbA